MSRLLRLALMLAWTVTVQAEATAPGLATALSSYGAGDHAGAARALKALAESGDGQAQLLLGHLYEHGRGVSRNAEQAARWYREAARQGLPEAQYQLGLLHELGSGVPKDLGEAESWYQRAIDQGFCPGELHPGSMLGEP